MFNRKPIRPVEISLIADKPPYEFSTWRGRKTARILPHVTTLGIARIFEDNLDVSRADALDTLPHDLVVPNSVLFGELTICGNEAIIHADIPPSTVVSLIGRHLGELVSHRLLDGHPAADAIITAAETATLENVHLGLGLGMGDITQLCLTLDRAPFHPKV